MITKIKNTGATRFIGYLPPHGKQMTQGEIIYLEGDLRTILASGENRYTRSTEAAALDYDLAHALITLNDEDDSSHSA